MPIDAGQRHGAMKILLETLRTNEPIDVDLLLEAAAVRDPSLMLEIYNECHHLIDEGVIDLWPNRTATLDEEASPTRPYQLAADAIRAYFLFESNPVDEWSLVSAVEESSAASRYHIEHMIARLLYRHELCVSQSGQIAPCHLQLPDSLLCVDLG